MTADRVRLPVAGWRRTVARLAGAVAPQWGRLLAVVVAMVAAGALGLVTPRLLGSIVDVVAHDGGSGEIALRAGYMALAAIGCALSAAVGVALSALVFETVLAELREEMLSTVLALPLARVEAVGSGDVLSRATDDVDQVSTAIGKALPSLLIALTTVVVTIFGLVTIDWRFLIVAVVTLPIYVFTARMYLRRAPDLYRSEREAAADRAHHVLGPIQGLPTVHAFDLGDRLSTRIDRHSWNVVRWSMRATVLQARMGGRLNFAEFVGMTSILLVGYALVGNGEITVGATTAAMLFFLALFGPIGQLMYVLDEMQSGAAALGRIVGVLDERSPAAGGTETPADNGSGLVGAGIGFGYSADNPILHEVSIAIAPGEHVALVGMSGAGKSTLAAILAGIHEADSGTVRLGGVPITQFDDAERARRVALLTQEVHVFSGSLRDDLRLARPAADDEQIWAALAKVGVADRVRSWADGLDTRVGDHGHQVDSMTAQQLALARIELLDPDVVIVDEATADAGSAGAGALEDAASAVLAGRSALIIAHRLTQAAVADRIVFLDAGRVVESGAHDELVAAGGRYSEVWGAWRRGRQD